MNKRLLAAVLAAAALLALCGCGGRKTADPSMEELRQSMLAAAPSLPEMKTVDDGSDSAAELFAYLSDMDYGKVEHFFLSYSAKGLADEIAVIAVKDAADAAAAQASLQRHLEGRRLLYEQYQPDQVPRVESAELFVKGSCAVLIVCDEARQVKEAFLRTVG